MLQSISKFIKQINTTLIEIEKLPGRYCSVIEVAIRKLLKSCKINLNSKKKKSIKKIYNILKEDNKNCIKPYKI